MFVVEASWHDDLHTVTAVGRDVHVNIDVDSGNHVAHHNDRVPSACVDDNRCAVGARNAGAS